VITNATMTEVNGEYQVVHCSFPDKKTNPATSLIKNDGTTSKVAEQKVKGYIVM